MPVQTAAPMLLNNERVQFITGTTTINANAQLIINNGATATGTLPHASECKGQIKVNRNITAHKMTFAAVAGETLYGAQAATDAITDFTIVYSDGMDWYILASYAA